MNPTKYGMTDDSSVFDSESGSERDSLIVSQYLYDDDPEESYYSSDENIVVEDPSDGTTSNSDLSDQVQTRNESDSDDVIPMLLNRIMIAPTIGTGAPMTAGPPPRNITYQKSIICQIAEEELAKRISEAEIKLAEDIAITMSDPMSIRNILFELPGVNPDDPRFELFWSGIV